MEGPEPAVGQCNDGVDNDGQNGTDFPTDGSCLWAADATEGPEPTSGQCADSLDNDGDGDFDGADDDCSASLDETEGAEPRVYAVHADHLGTPRLLTDLEGRPVWRALYAAYGRAVVESGSGVEFNVRFPGQYFDAESGLHYNRFRYYEPRLGRYISADPVGQEAGRNVFEYGTGSPSTATDPMGLVAGTIASQTIGRALRKSAAERAVGAKVTDAAAGAVATGASLSGNGPELGGSGATAVAIVGAIGGGQTVGLSTAIAAQSVAAGAGVLSSAAIVPGLLAFAGGVEIGTALDGLISRHLLNGDRLGDLLFDLLNPPEPCE